MNSNTSENHQLPSEIPEMDITEIILDDQQHNSNSLQLEKTLYPANQEDEKELNVEDNNSELSKKSTSVDDNKKEEKKNESKNLLSENNTKRPDNNNGISSQKKRNKIKKKLSLSLKNYLKKLLKKKISRKSFKILFKKNEIIHKLLEIIKKYKNKKKNRGFLKDILIRSIRRLLKNNDINCKNPKKLLESVNLNINNLNYYSDSLENVFFWINKNYDNENNDEILSEKNATKIGDISCNKDIYNIMDNEALYMATEDTLYIHFLPFHNLPNTNYTTV